MRPLKNQTTPHCCERPCINDIQLNKSWILLKWKGRSIFIIGDEVDQSLWNIISMCFAGFKMWFICLFGLSKYNLLKSHLQ